MEVFGVATVFFKIPSEIKYKIINRAGSGIYIIAPNYLQDMLSGYHLAFVFDQQFEQGYFFFTQFLGCTVFINSIMRRKINSTAFKRKSFQLMIMRLFYFFVF